MAKKLTKQDVKGPDAFVSTVDQVSDVLYKHRRPLYLVVGGLLAIGVIYSSISLYTEKTERKAQVALYEVESQYQTTREAFEKAQTEAQAQKGKKKTEPSKLNMASGNLDQDYGSIVKGYKNVIKEHQDTKASAIASLELANIYSEYGKLDEATSVLEKASSGLDSDELFYAFVNLELGNLYQQKGQCEKSVSNWQKIVESTELEFLHAPTLVKTGICYETLGQIDKARAVYNRASKDFADSSSGQTAKTYLRLLDSKTK